MNRFMITPAQVQAMKLPGVNFMYPGDVWDSAVRAFRSGEAVERYMKDLENLQIDPTPAAVPAETIRQSVLNLLQAMRKRFSKVVLARIEPFAIHTHDTNQIFKIDPGACRCEVSEATPESAAQARYVMCSQVAWYTFAYTWGWNVAQGGGAFLDREFKEKGENQFWRRCVTELSTDILRFDSRRRFFRTLEFLWRRKFEIFHHVFGKQISDEAVSKASVNAAGWYTGSAASA